MRMSSNTILRLMTVAFVLVSTGVGNTFASRTLATKHEQPAMEVVQEEVKKFKGVVVKRDPDSFTMSETTGGPTTTVILTANTEVKSHKRGVLRGSKEYAASYILRGLRLEVDGVRNSEGHIVADKIRFDEQDLRTAQALKATVDPLEAEMNEKLRLQQEEQERLAGQIRKPRLSPRAPEMRLPKHSQLRTMPTIGLMGWMISIRSRQLLFISILEAPFWDQKPKRRSTTQPRG